PRRCGGGPKRTQPLLTVRSASPHGTAHHSTAPTAAPRLRAASPNLCAVSNRISLPIPSVIGRERELDELDRLSQALLNGESHSLIIHGETGIGKTTILEQFIATHESWQIVPCTGVECEAELAWAALHQLCIPILKYLPRISAPHSAALKAAFGLAE